VNVEVSGGFWVSEVLGVEGFDETGQVLRVICEARSIEPRFLHLL
jgi:hypothetical protein